MKKLLPLLFAALTGLASCSKSDDPAAKASSSIVGTWNWTAEQSVTTPKSGGSPTTTNKNVTPGSLVVTYGADGSIKATALGSAQAAGTYTLSGTTLTTVQGGKTTTSTTSELSANKLVLVTTSSDAGNNYTDTDTFTR